MIRECSQLTHLFFLWRSYAFVLRFNPALWNRAETGLKCNTGITGPWALAYTESLSKSLLAVMCPGDKLSRITSGVCLHTASGVYLSPTFASSHYRPKRAGERDTQQENSNSKQAVTNIYHVTVRLAVWMRQTRRRHEVYSTVYREICYSRGA